MKTIFFILSVFLFANVGCSNTSTTRAPSSVGEVLSGKFFKVRIPLQSKESIARTYSSIVKEAPEIASEITQRMNKGHFQRSARIMGLDFCRERNFESIGAVFWTGQSLIGVHCLRDAKLREEVLRKSYTAGCNVLKFRARSCPQTSKYRFSEISDMTRSEGQNSSASGVQ